MTWESPYEKKKQPKKIEALLDSLLHKLSGSTSQDIKEIIENWEVIIGGSLSKLSSPSHIKNQILYIQVVDSGVAREIEWRKAEALKAANENTSKVKLEDMKIIIKQE
tara:strand:- start:68 stop:391 length:324 start_codon:yes stop_codon:yes gene_type:complete